MGRRKSLLIGINYTGSQHQLRGCQQDVQNVAGFLEWKGYSSNPRDQVIMTDAMSGPYYPNSYNVLAAMEWLVSEPECTCFLHYSGHGGQVRDPQGIRPSGYNDTICPVDFEQNGQIDSSTLHNHLVSHLHPSSTLFIIFDCCHSGSAVELPWVYRSDEDGNVGVMDNIQAGMQMVGAAEHLIEGGLSFQSVADAQQLLGGARDFFRGMKHRHEHQAPGLQAEQGRWGVENKFVTMFSGCRDDQTSADANIAGAHVGACSWAFLEMMKSGYQPTYLQTLQGMRQVLMQSHYTQVPQLSTGVERMDLDQPLCI